MANYFRALGCPPQPAIVRRVPTRTLRGYRAVTLAGLGAPPAAAGTPALLPVSDPKAIAAAVRLFQRGRGRG